MRKILFLFCIACIPLFATWQAIGPEGGNVRAVVISPSNQDVVYFAAYTYPCKIYKSTNAGAVWSKVGSYNGYCYCLAIGSDEKLYAGYYGVYRSTDGGATWVSSSIPSTYVYDLVVHPSNPAIVYGAGYKYLSGSRELVFIKSTNSGVNWTTSRLDSGLYCYGYSIAVDPANGNNIYVGGNGYDTRYLPKIFKSTDGGSSFSEVFSDTIGYYVYSLAVHPTNSNIVYAGTYLNGIFRSTNAGANWTRVSTLNYNYAMATTPANPNLILGGALSSIYRSTDAGITWASIATGLKGTYFRGLAISRTSAANAFSGCDAGFYKTTNMGTNWQAANTNFYAGIILDFGVAPSQKSTMYTEFENVGVYKTTNYGSSWNLLPTPSTCGALCAFVVHNTDPNAVCGLEGTG